MYVYAYIVGGHIAKLSVTTGFFKVKTKEEVDTMIMYYILHAFRVPALFMFLSIIGIFIKLKSVVAGRSGKIFAVWGGRSPSHHVVVLSLE